MAARAQAQRQREARPRRAHAKHARRRSIHQHHGPVAQRWGQECRLQGRIELQLGAIPAVAVVAAQPLQGRRRLKGLPAIRRRRLNNRVALRLQPEQCRGGGHLAHSGQG